MDNETMNEDISNEEVEVEVEQEEVVREEASEEETETETQDDRDTKIEELEKQVKTLKIQKAKKAEKAQKVEKEEVTQGGLSTDDLYSLMTAKVAREDVATVTKYAKFEGISVDEALKSNVVQTILTDKANARKVAGATNTGSARRGSSEVSEDVLLANARKGKMPESDADMDRLIEARMNSRK